MTYDLNFRLVKYHMRISCNAADIEMMMSWAKRLSFLLLLSEATTTYTTSSFLILQL
jgi:hypothetical protein